MKNFKGFFVPAMLAVIAFAGCNKDMVTTPVAKLTPNKKTASSGMMMVTKTEPSSGIVYGAVRLIGTNFDPVATNNSVFFNKGSITAKVNYASASGDTLIVTVPLGATTGNITVTKPGFLANSPVFNVLQLTKDGTIPQQTDKIIYLAYDNAGATYAVQEYGYLGGNDYLVKSINGNVQRIYSIPPDSTSYRDNGMQTTVTHTHYTINGLLVDAANNLYFGLVRNGDSYNDDYGLQYYNVSIYKVNPQGQVSLFTHDADQNSSQGNLNKYQYDKVQDMAMDAAGNIYFGHESPQSISKIPASGGSVPYDNFVGSTANYNMAIDQSGNIYVNDQSQITKVSPAGKRTVIATGYKGKLGSMIADKQGNIFIANAPSVLVVNTAGQVNSVPAGLVAGSTLALDNLNRVCVIAPNGITRYSFK